MKYLIVLSFIAVLCLGGWFWFQNQTSQQPNYYGRALFGSNPSDSEAWQHFIVQGDKVFVDKNKDDIPDDAELFVWSDKLKLQVNGQDFSIVSAQAGIDPNSVSETLPQRLQLVVDVHEKRPYQMAGKILLTKESDGCNWLQFGGDLRFIVMEKPKLRAGSKKAAELKIFIGTTTSGPPSLDEPDNEPNSLEPDVFRSAVLLPVRKPPFPTLELAFSNDDSVTPTQQLTMDEFC